MPHLEQELESTQRAFLSLQIENAQLKLSILDLRKQLSELQKADEDE